MTPHNSEASIIFGKGVTSAKPGSAQSLVLAMDDIDAARADLIALSERPSERQLSGGGSRRHRPLTWRRSFMFFPDDAVQVAGTLRVRRAERRRTHDYLKLKHKILDTQERTINVSTSIHASIGKQQLDRREAMDLTWAQKMEAVGRHTIRYGLVLVLLWIGGMKFTAYEAEGISGFVSNSPLMSWVYSVFSIRSFSALLGVTEIVIALLIAARPLSARAALVGSALAVGMFLTTLSFLLTTPGVWEVSAGGFPALSVVPGQFLIKDFVLFGASLWMCGEDWRTLTTSRSHQQQAK
jgi:reactive chlorine resistance protein C